MSSAGQMVAAMVVRSVHQMAAPTVESMAAKWEYLLVALMESQKVDQRVVNWADSKV